MHHAVHDKGRAGQVARILHERDEQVEDHDVGQEDDHGAHAAYDAVHQQVAQRSGGHHVVDRAADPSHQRVDPLLRIGSEAERAPEHEPHQEEEDRESPQLMRHEGVDQRRGRSLLALARSEGLPERALYESVFLIGDRRFDIFAQRFADALGFQLGVAAAFAEALFGLGVAFEHLHRIVAGREGFGQLAAESVHVAVQAAQPLFDDGPHVDMDVAHALVLILVYRDHRVEQLLDALAVARLDGHHRHAEHAAQVVVIQLCTA